ncbi:hypothetical protein CBR_g35011 [Chara braunii]|uniref:G-patch domain-containing protein n=1 Tax=Chara braunii TaxID=69332 RepID=A0A388LJZ7_CHABU|nr:hypothetical protein CBR_g35011 [Chara braunii]|eukprot:GBG82646.1 hypothetical protein CBR_g35011 [Chara braunii]
MAGTGVRQGALLYQGVNRSTFAFKLMKQMGWEEGEGLGVNKQGIKSHVRATKKADVTAGVGLVEARKMASDWTCHASVYDKLLKSLKSVYETSAAPGAKRDSDDDDSDSDSDISEEKGVVDAAKKNSEKGGGGGGDDPSKKEEVNAPKKKEASPLKKEERKPDVKERDSVAVKTGENPSSGASSRSGDEELPKTSRSLKPLRVVRVVDASAKALEEAADAPPVGEWWGSKFGFVRGGTLCGSSERDAQRANGDERDAKPSSEDKIQISMFQEEDQERLYKTVQDNATTGKMGLGRSSMPKKVAGARWTGKKMQFCSDDEEDDDDNEGMDSDNCLPNGSCGGTSTETAPGPEDDVPSVAKEPCEDSDANCVKNAVQPDEGEQVEKPTGQHKEMKSKKEKAGKKKRKKREMGGEVREEAIRASPKPSSSCEQASIEDCADDDGIQKNHSKLTTVEHPDGNIDAGARVGNGEVGGVVDNGVTEAGGLDGVRCNSGNQRRKGKVDDRRTREVSGKEARESSGRGDEDEVAGKSEDRREKKRRKKAKDATAVAGSSEAVVMEAAAGAKRLSKERHDNPHSKNTECRTRAKKGIGKEERVCGREREEERDGPTEFNHASSPNAGGEPDMWSENLDKALKRVKWKRLTAEVLQKALSEGVKLRVLERMVRRAVRAMDARIDETKLHSLYRRKVRSGGNGGLRGVDRRRII